MMADLSVGFGTYVARYGNTYVARNIWHRKPGHLSFVRQSFYSTTDWPHSVKRQVAPNVARTDLPTDVVPGRSTPIAQNYSGDTFVELTYQTHYFPLMFLLRLERLSWTLSERPPLERQWSGGCNRDWRSIRTFPRRTRRITYRTRRPPQLLLSPSSDFGKCPRRLQLSSLGCSWQWGRGQLECCLKKIERKQLLHYAKLYNEKLIWQCFSQVSAEWLKYQLWSLALQ